MRMIGLIRELERKAAVPLPRLVDLRNRLPEADVAVIAAYLERGEVASDAMGLVADPLDPTIVIPGGAGLQSDGRWVWRQDLAHYVRRYRVSLARDFVQTALSAAAVPESATAVPKLSPSQMDDAIRESFRALRVPGHYLPY